MNNAIMLVHNRPMLTNQAIRSFLGNSKFDWSLTVVDDGSHYQTGILLEGFARHAPNMRVVRHAHPTRNTAFNRNLGVYWSEHFFGRGDWLYLSDNDAYFTPSWDLVMVRAMQEVGHEYLLLGPYRHPYHQPHDIGRPTMNVGGHMYQVVSTDAVQGIGWLLAWTSWDKFGALIEHKGEGHGTNQSEDFEWCQRVVKAGFKVGSVEPHVVYNCGVTGSDGKPSPGSERMNKVEGVYYE